MSDAVATLDTLEAAVAAFEAARLAGLSATVEEYLPEGGPGDRARVACELVRVDLEISDSHGAPRSVDDYRDAVPELFARPTLLGQVAFEEYRLALARGERPTVAEQLRRYGLERRFWPTPLDGPTGVVTAYPSPGEQFDGMPLERLLGSGAFSRVFVARQPKFGGRSIALKLTLMSSVEPDRLGRLQHTNIVPVYSAHFDRGLLGVAMPLLGERTLADLTVPPAPVDGAGSTLRAAAGSTIAEPGATTVPPAAARAARSAGLPWRRAAAIVADVAAGLAHAHARGIVHGDIKPANILLGDDGVPRLLDFNLASDASRQAPETLVVGGTIPYLAPEHLSALVEGARVTPACDQYSLGVVLYELLAGERPFPARVGDFAESVAAMRSDRLAAPHLPGGAPAPPGLRAIVAKCLAPAPADRYPDVAAFEAELRRELADEPLRHTREPSLTARLAKWRRRHTTNLARGAFVGLGVVTLAAAFVALQWRDRSATLAARQAIARFDAQRGEARLALALPHPEEDLRAAGLAAADTAAAAVLEAGVLPRLTTDERRRVTAGVGELIGLIPAGGRPASVDRLAGEVGAAGSRETRSVLAEALAFLERGEFLDASELLASAIAERPRDPSLWLQRGVAEAGAGRLETALAALTAASALQPESAIVRRTLAAALLDAGRFAEALEQLSLAPAEGDSAGPVALNRALALLGLGRHSEAVAEASVAIGAGFERPRAYLLRARCREAAGDIVGAESDRAAARSAPAVDDADWAARAVAMERSAPESALAEVERGLAAHPDSVVLLRNQLHLLGDVLGRRDEALAVAGRLSEALPDDVAAQLGGAVCLASRGSFSEALAVADRVAPRVERPIDRLQLACVYTLGSGGDVAMVERGVDHATAALAAEPTLAPRAARDPDLAALRSEPRFRRAVAAAASLSVESAAAELRRAQP